MALPVIDAFAGTNGNTLTTYNANWVLPYGSDLEIQSSAVACSAASSRCTARWHGDTWPDGQYAKATLLASADGYWAVVCRHTTAVAITYYAGGIDMNDYGHSRYAIWKWTAGAFASIAVHASQTPVANDIVKLTVTSGNALSLYVNDMVTPIIGPTTDGSPLGSGEAGMSVFHSVAHIGFFDNFDGGALTVASTRLALIGGGVGASAKIIGG